MLSYFKCFLFPNYIVTYIMHMNNSTLFPQQLIGGAPTSSILI